MGLTPMDSWRFRGARAVLRVRVAEGAELDAHGAVIAEEVAAAKLLRQEAPVHAGLLGVGRLEPGLEPLGVFKQLLDASVRQGDWRGSSAKTEAEAEAEAAIRMTAVKGKCDLMGVLFGLVGFGASSLKPRSLRR